MSSRPDYDIEQLKRLIEATLDSADGYRDAAEDAAGSRFADLFRTRATERKEIVVRLQGEVRRLGGELEVDGTVIGLARRWFANLKDSVTDGAATVVSVVEAGEDHVKEIYETVLQDLQVAPEVQALIASVYRTIKADHDRIHDLECDQQVRRAS